MCEAGGAESGSGSGDAAPAEDPRERRRHGNGAAAKPDPHCQIHHGELQDHCLRHGNDLGQKVMHGFN